MCRVRVNPILDVREADDFVAGHAAGAVNIPLEQLPSRMHELPEKGSSLQVYHDCPKLLGQAVTLLQSRGYPAVRVVCPDLPERGPSTACLWRPSPLLVEYAPKVPGRAADLACGSGREAVYLARQGWQVDAVDLLPDALAKARDLAARSGVTIYTHCHDLTRDIPLPERQYDLVTIFRYLHRPLLQAAGRLLRPGGMLLVETFHTSDTAGKDPARLAADGELGKLVSPLCQVEMMRDGVERHGRRYSQLVAVRSEHCG